MRKIRIIPRLDIKGPNLVKGINMEGLRVLGKPFQFAKSYYEEGADELILVDVVASLYGRNNLSNFVSETASNIFIPITVGGGIRNNDDVRKLLKSGADKVSLNTAAIENPNLINDLVKTYGSSTISVSCEVIKDSMGKYNLFTDNGREETNLELISWIEKVIDLGAGEIIVTDILKEGTGEGFDYNLIEKVLKVCKVPLLIHGGCRTKEDVLDVFKKFDLSGIVISSILHYDLIDRIKTYSDENEGNITFLSNKNKYLNFNKISIDHLKSFLKNNNVNVI